jgi:pyruvate,water dikinase
MNFVKEFSSSNPQHDNTSGGKGMSLALMYQNKLPIPDGFVVLSTAFEKFINDNKLNQEIDAILSGVNKEAMHTVENASEKIQSLILNCEFPDALKQEIINLFKSKNFKLVAVRSSATSEDSKNEAWAGQLDSFLNTEEDSLILNIQKCWASLFTPRAIFYRFQNKLHTLSISVAVVVQEMIQSEVSGIAFSVHPVTQNHDEAIIEAGYGLGEAIVSNKITPDSYTVNKIDGEILDKYLVTQAKKLVKGKENGNHWVEIPTDEQELQKLSDSQIATLTNFIIQIEKFYNLPQDIEWALKDGEFYITQSRPITTLE